MYYIYGRSGSSLLIESTDSMIFLSVLIIFHSLDCVNHKCIGRPKWAWSCMALAIVCIPKLGNYECYSYSARTQVKMLAKIRENFTLFARKMHFFLGHIAHTSGDSRDQVSSTKQLWALAIVREQELSPDIHIFMIACVVVEIASRFLHFVSQEYYLYDDIRVLSNITRY